MPILLIFITRTKQRSYIFLLMVSNIFSDKSRSDQLFRVLVRNLKPKLIFYGHDDLDMIQAVKAEVIDEVAVEGELVCRDLVKSLAHIEHPALNISWTQTGKVPHSKVSSGWVLDRHFDVDTIIEHLDCVHKLDSRHPRSCLR